MSATHRRTAGADAALRPDAAELRARLLAFYDARRRDLPWRHDADPYRVWVSEIMLQQTRVDAVVPYYERWMQRFPTLAALAHAGLDDVLKQWEGLGYYARARNLHRTARVVRERYGGQLPADPRSLRQLPGVGEYTAGAIASIAFGIPAPAVDGNVRRVLSRLDDLPDPTPAQIRRTAAALVPGERPGDFNQALMELGATRCTPRAPGCAHCPVATHCLARARGTAEQRPLPRPAKAIPEDDVGTAVIRSTAGRLLLARRPEDGLLGGLWEFPGAVAQGGEPPATAATRAARAALGLRARARGLEPDDALGTVVHTFTHRRIAYHAHAFVWTGVRTASGRTPAPRRPEAETVWITPEELADYALPAAQRKIARLAQGSI